MRRQVFYAVTFSGSEGKTAGRIEWRKIQKGSGMHAYTKIVKACFRMHLYT